mgnify:CR=1 FL=1
MRAILQRVSCASVVIDGKITRNTGAGLLILLGVTQEDTEEQAAWLARKCCELRIFSDEQDKMNLSLFDTNGEAMVISNFTLYADCKKGRRPSYVRAARPEQANGLYERFVEEVRTLGIKNVQTGEFGADMQVSITNDGPVTIFLDTDEIRPK